MVAVQRGVVRLVSRGLMLTALLTGLFAMHGLTNSAGGCMSIGGGSVSSAMASSHAGMAGHAMPKITATGPILAMPILSPGHHNECVATVPKGGSTTAVLFLVAMVLATALLPVGSAVLRRGSDWRRGPPIAGVRLLHLVCVSRT